MENKLTLRDKLAISMESISLPKLQNEETINYVAEKIGLEFSSDALNQIEFAFAYQAIMRYKYADAMLKARG